MARRLIVGCGYVGLRVATTWIERGDQVPAVTRSPARARELEVMGIDPVIADIAADETLGQLPEADSLLFAVGYDRTSPYSMMCVQRDGLSRVLDRLLPQVTVVMVGSTGVYGSSRPDWIDESSDCRPEREGGQACLAAEELLIGRSPSRRWIVLRSAGIYGPGRVHLAGDLQDEPSLSVASDHWLNLIHVDDLTQIIDWATVDCRQSGRFNVSDGCPVQRRDYYRYVVELHGLPRPEFREPPEGDAARDRTRGSKRISNGKLLQQLPFRLRFPSYREGLTAILGSCDSR